jgi:UDP-N-acetylmuramoyl-L-alanyl-D-glutamate--2,6-diaminopimelate ligase
MILLRLRDVLHSISGITTIEGQPDIAISGITYDSRKVRPGYVFVAIRGYKQDGHKFVPDAIKNGAVAVIAEHRPHFIENLAIVTVKNSRKALSEAAASYYGYPFKRLKVIGVTGTNGKTTTTYLIKQTLEKAGYKVGLIGTVANMIGERVIPAERTTPESSDVFKLFAQMADESVSHVVMEVSSHSVELYRVHNIEFETGLFTNLTQDHLDFHGSMDKYFEAKRKMFSQCNKAVVNVDDSYGKRLAESLEIPCVSYSISNTSDVRAQNIKYSLNGVEFDMKMQEGTTDIKLSIPGRFSVYNALAASCACLSLGIPIETVKTALAETKGVPGRFEVVDEGMDFSVVVDYAHTPDGLINILSSAREVTQNRLITVFGCGGDRDKTKRPIMGRIGVELSDICIITSDNPRSENPEAIIEDIVKGAAEADGNYVSITDRKAAIEHAIKLAKPGDMIVIAGKGHETYQIIGNNVLPFDDRKVAREILRRHKH